MDVSKPNLVSVGEDRDNDRKKYFSPGRELETPD